MEPYVTAYGHRAFWSADGQRFYFVYQERGEHHIWSVPAQGGDRDARQQSRRRPRRLRRDGRARCVRLHAQYRNRRQRHLLPARRSAGPNGASRNLATRWAGVREPQEVAFKSFDGLYMQGFLYLPAADRRGPAVPGAGAGARRRLQLLHAQPEPDRAVPGVEGLRRAGHQLSRRLRLRPRVPGSRGQRLAERPGARIRARRRTCCARCPT